MDIKDIVEKKESAVPVSESKPRQPVNTDRSQPVDHSESNSVQDKIDVHHRSSQAADLREKANVAVSLTNVTSTATDDIEQMVASINGIVEQASAEQVNDRQLNLLEREANQLVAAIRNRALTTSSNGVNPLLGDKIKLEVEEKLGRTLEFILPDVAANSFGLGELSFTPRDMIIATIAKVNTAQEQVRQLRKAVDEVGVAVKEAVAKLEVTIRNSEAAAATVADVDAALHLAEETKGGITTNPQKALNSVGVLNRHSVNLLD